jgi:RND family efflux transporter MFP subunit
VAISANLTTDGRGEEVLPVNSAIVRWTRIGLCLFGLSLLVGTPCLTGCNFGAAAPVVKLPPPVVVFRTPDQEKKVTDYFEFPGQLAAVGDVEIRARVTGYLTKVYFEDGQNVKKDQPLYEIDPRPYQAALEQAQGELARWEALLEKGKADMARSERLRPSGAISEDEYEQHKANLASIKASIKTSQAAVREARLNLEFTQITSPIDGRVSRTRITEGNLIQPGTGDAAILTTVVTTNPVYVYFNVDENALLKYRDFAMKAGLDLHPKRLKDLKSPVEIGLGDETGFPHAGILDFADNKVDRTTGTLRARGVFDNAKDSLTPGLFVRVRIPYGVPHEALLVPEKSICRDQRERYLKVVNEKNIVEYKKVEIGDLHDGLREIRSGIGPRDRVVVLGLQRAQQDAEVTPIDEATAAARARQSKSKNATSTKADGGSTKK